MGSKLGKIQAALRDGCLAYGFMAVNGCVSISIKQKGGHLLGFGESVGVRNALHKTDEGLSISGALVEAALAAEVTTCEEIIEIVALLDDQMRFEKMSVFIAYWDGVSFSFRLNGTREVSVPGDMIELVMSTGREVEWSSERGYSYMTAPDSKSPMVGPISTVLLFAPGGKEDDGFGLSYPISKIGFGRSFWEAVHAAVHAQEFETGVSTAW